MLVTDVEDGFGDEKDEILMTVLAILVTNINYLLHYRRAPTFKRCHQHWKSPTLKVSHQHWKSVTNIHKTHPQKTMKSALLVCYYCAQFAWAVKIFLLLDIWVARQSIMKKYSYWLYEKLIHFWKTKQKWIGTFSKGFEVIKLGTSGHQHDLIRNNADIFAKIHDLK